MEVFDFNIHFTRFGNVEMPHLLSDETRMGVSDLTDSLTENMRLFQSVFKEANFMLFNQKVFFNNDNLHAFMAKVKNEFPASCFTALLDFRHKNALEAVDNAMEQGVAGIKFHSYFQRIGTEDFPAVLRTAKRAQEKNAFICVDTSYGTSGMYRFDNMKLACLLADELTCPIILLHSGGLRVMEAMLLAEEKRNIFLESSFTLPFYKGSTIEQDIVFAYYKLGASRLLYGSDHPYVNIEQSIQIVMEYLEECGFSEQQVHDVMYGNAMKLLANI